MNDKYILITTENRISLRSTGGAGFYETLREAVDGDIEHVKPRGLKHPQCMIVNKEWLCRELPLNEAGSILYGSGTMFGKVFALFGSPIAGDIVICKDGFTEQGYDIVPLEDGVAKKIYKDLRRGFPFLEPMEDMSHA